jgi:hypothetical protein
VTVAQVGRLHHRAPSVTGTPLRARLSARVHGRALTRALAGGVDPRANARLLHRARVMARRRIRRRIARGIEGTIADAERQDLRWGSAAPFDYRGVLEARSELLALAAALRDRDEVNARGVAMADLLLTDYASPLYQPIDRQALCDAAVAARGAL